MSAEMHPTADGCEAELQKTSFRGQKTALPCPTSATRCHKNRGSGCWMTARGYECVDPESAWIAMLAEEAKGGGTNSRPTPKNGNGR